MKEEVIPVFLVALISWFLFGRRNYGSPFTPTNTKGENLTLFMIFFNPYEVLILD